MHGFQSHLYPANLFGLRYLSWACCNVLLLHVFNSCLLFAKTSFWNLISRKDVPYKIENWLPFPHNTASTPLLVRTYTLISKNLKFCNKKFGRPHLTKPLPLSAMGKHPLLWTFSYFWIKFSFNQQICYCIFHAGSVKPFGSSLKIAEHYCGHIFLHFQNLQKFVEFLRCFNPQEAMLYVGWETMQVTTANRFNVV